MSSGQFTRSMKDGANPSIAVFDFDKTITDRHTFWRFMRYSAGWAKFYLAVLVLAPSIARYFMKQISLMDLRGRAIRYFFEGLSYDSYVSLCKKFVNSHINFWVSADAAGRIQWHRENGHYLVLLSNSPEEYLRIWAHQHGFDMVIGTQLEFKDGVASGGLCGPSCFGKEKVARLVSAFPNLQEYYVYAYGDSPTDRYVLEIASESFYQTFNLTKKYHGYKQ